MKCETDCIGCKKVKEYTEKKKDPNLYKDWMTWRKLCSEIGVEAANEKMGFNKDGGEK